MERRWGERESGREEGGGSSSSVERERERVRERGTCELTLTMLVIFWRLTGLVRFGHQASLANLGEAPHDPPRYLGGAF